MATSKHLPVDLLECGLCLELMIPPIFQCADGHTFCSSCKSKLTSCAVCRNGTIDVRCRALEKFVETIGDVDCRFAKYGCRASIPYLEKKTHETKCHYRSINCLIVGCNFDGAPEELANHLCTEHNFQMMNTNKIEFTCKSDNVTHRFQSPAAEEGRLATDNATEEEWVWQNQVYHCFDKYYVLRIHRKAEYDAQLFISVAALTARHHPNRYTVAAVGNYRQYTFEGPVWSITKGFKEVERVRDCLMIPMNIAFFLSGGKGSEKDMGVLDLKIVGTIHPHVPRSVAAGVNSN